MILQEMVCCNPDGTDSGSGEISPLYKNDTYDSYYVYALKRNNLNSGTTPASVTVTVDEEYYSRLPRIGDTLIVVVEGVSHYLIGYYKSQVVDQSITTPSSSASSTTDTFPSINIGQFSESLNAKADRDLKNLSSEGREFVGIKAYDSSVSYSLGEFIITVISDEVKLYRSLANNNTSALTDGTKWKEVSLGGGGGADIGDMGFAPLGIDESLNLRRYLNGQVISQSLSPAFTAKVKAAIALHSSLGTTEANWQSEKTLSKLGQCGKFVIDDENNTIRLPAIVNAQGLLGLSGIGSLVNESLPNITGAWAGVYNSNGLSGAVSANYSTSAGAYPQSSIIDANVYGLYNIDASRSSSTYQNNAPVQQEAVQYPYYIQVATGIEETLPAIREYKVNNSDFFGKSMYSDVAPDNASWLASNGSYNAKTVYPDYYDWLNGKVGQVITANGGKVVLSTGTITDYDFVVNQNDQTFRLPLLNGEEDLQSDRYDTLTITGSPSSFVAQANGSFVFVAQPSNADNNSWISITNNTTGDTDRSYSTYNIGFTVCIKALKGESVTIEYGNNAIGTSGNVRFYYAKGNGTLYYYVGDTVQDASLINAGAVLGQLSNKADIDLSNLSNGLANTICTTAVTTTSTASVARPAVVVENYKNGTSWYRIYSDGWIEQGGTANVGANSQFNGTFLKPFKDTNICFLATDNGTSLYVNSYGSQQGCGVASKSTFFLRSATDYTVLYSWFACGTIN